MDAHILEQHEIFELLPTHGKVVTLDADLPMKHALAALASHGATCLPVWDSALQRFVDVFSCTDLVDIVLFAHRALAGAGAPPAAGAAAGDAQTALERCHLRDLHGLKRPRPAGFLMASVDDSMLHGALMLKQHALECLPIGDSACSSSLLHLLLPEQLLAFLATLPELRTSHGPLLEEPVGKALLPLCRQPQTVRRDASLLEALGLLSAERLHALPVLDASGALFDVLSSRDVRQLASNPATDLAIPLEEALRSLPPKDSRVQTCALSDTVATAITRLADPEAAQLVCLNDAGAVCAVVTASAVLAALLPSSPPHHG